MTFIGGGFIPSSGVKKAVSDLNSGVYKRALTVASEAEMFAACTPGQQIDFTVTLDTDGETNVPYTWNGATLFYLGIEEAETQPS